MKRLYRIILLLLLISLTGCLMMGPSAETEGQGGSGSEIVGVVEYPDSSQSGTGKALAGAGVKFFPVIAGSVFLFPHSYIPSLTTPAVPRVYTGNDGSFRIAGVSTGTLMLEVGDGKGMGLVRTIVIDRDSSLVDVGTLIVQKTAGIRIAIDNSAPSNILVSLSLRGTRFIVQGSTAGTTVAFDNIPAGATYTMHVEILKPVAKAYDITSITLVPGVITSLSDKITGL